MANWKETYVNLATEIDATVSDAVEDYAHLKAARLVMIDITTIDDGSLPGYGTEAATYLLTEMDIFVRHGKMTFPYVERRQRMVKSINDFTIRFYGDLDDFVNNLDWPDLCVPVIWTAISEDGGTDTSNWDVCS
jgi:hypothetical protein